MSHSQCLPLFEPQSILNSYSFVFYDLSYTPKKNLHFTLRTLELFICCPPWYVTMHTRGLLWSARVGWKVSDDMTCHRPLSSPFDCTSIFPEWLQVKTGGLLGQEWNAEQEADTVSPCSTSSFTLIVTASGTPVTTKKALILCSNTAWQGLFLSATVPGALVVLQAL